MIIITIIDLAIYKYISVKGFLCLESLHLIVMNIMNQSESKMMTTYIEKC
jgi:hypothetical protein